MRAVLPRRHRRSAVPNLSLLLNALWLFVEFESTFYLIAVDGVEAAAVDAGDGGWTVEHMGGKCERPTSSLCEGGEGQHREGVQD